MTEVSGLPTPGAAAYWTLEKLKAGRRVALVYKQLEEIEEAEGAIKALAPLFPDLSVDPALFTEDALSVPAGLEKLLAGSPVALVQSEALDKPIPGRAAYAKERLKLSLGTKLSRNDLLVRLERLGYRREDFADTPGDYAVRGSVTDFFLAAPPLNVRVFWEEDSVESIRVFEPATQRTADILEEIVLAPISTTGESALSEWLDGFELADFAAERKGESSGFLANPRFQGRLEFAVKQARSWLAEGWKVILFSLNRGEDERMQETLEGKLEGVQFLTGPLLRGFQRPGEKLAILTSSEIYERSYRARARWAAGPKTSLRWRDLKAGDYVVHGDYGIARYEGLRPVPVGAVTNLTASQLAEEDVPKQELLLLEFRGGDKLFVPLWEFRKVQRYVGAGGRHPRLSSLDTESWERIQGKVREGVRELAGELLKLEAERAARPGFAFAGESHLEREFADSFPYEETPDQVRTLEDVFRDMERATPMNRVVIGDVGFGKTEIAMRAALKCVVGGRQAAILVPTTILADQHRRNFQRRLADYPVKVAELSRFQTKAQQKEVADALAKGRVDIVIGTHRLLQKDVKLEKLGLVVVDEEHRFGVRDKERLKKLSATTHYLALSATPIPRTLYQSLSGLREISLIASPPAGRLPIVTKVGPMSDELVAQAIRAEMDRGGQVYYVHNRVKGLAERMKELEKLAPGARFALAHGQMSAHELEKTMWDFFGRKFDVLVASSIIESGLDIATVNTLIVENAHEFGLAQLYQLRGRIGRERTRAYCFLTYPEGPLTEEAKLRLDALEEFSHLGSGFHLAMRDLEIRGAGELLGSRQHGFVTAVGLETYCDLLREEVERLKGRGPKAEKTPTTLDLTLAAFLPADYLPDEMQRLDTYKRILAATPAELDAIRTELADLAGQPPPPVENLLRLARLRQRASESGLRSVLEREGRLELYFRPDAGVSPATLKRWTSFYGGRLSFVPSPEGDGVRLALLKAAVDETEAFLSTLEAK